MSKLPDFTKPEIANLLEKCNFKLPEKELFLLRNDEKGYSMEECAEIMHISVSTAYRISKKMKKKILRVI